MHPTSQRSNPEQSDFVADGADRLVTQVKPIIVPPILTTVQAEYAERLAKAGPLRRVWLRWWMRKEIERRVGQEMPSPESLY